MSDSIEIPVRVNRERKMVFNKIFRLRFLVLVVLATCLWAVYYFILRDPDASFGEGWVHQDDYVIPGNRFPKSIHLEVYYESLCPDSRSFFLNHLLPAVHKFQSLLSVTLIPYGRAETLIKSSPTSSWGKIQTPETYFNPYDFKCQHGQPECLGNRVHACVIDFSRDNTVLAVNVTSCLFEDYFQSSYSEKCCQKFGLNWEEVKKCANDIQGHRLLADYGEMTNKLLPIDFIPTIVANRRRGNKHFQGRLLKDLSGELCRLFSRNNIQTTLCGPMSYLK